MSSGHDRNTTLVDSAAACTRPAQDQGSQRSSTSGGAVQEPPFLTEELWTADGFWERKDLFSLMVWPLDRSTMSLRAAQIGLKGLFKKIKEGMKLEVEKEEKSGLIWGALSGGAGRR